MARSKKSPDNAAKLGGMRPVLLAAGLALYWFVEYQGGGEETEAPMWGYMLVESVRVLADFVGAWFFVSALQLVLALSRFGLSQVRTLWLQGGR